ncbi:sigma 54-interacting transcriptional regulator [Mucilaginibacter sp.]|uniref:sigma-54 interaction domain-containing protein n=1 Tax=Mucilaginibacter sp. TaxID=1882438 RepID=UPI0025EFF50F|nr:sigma 54-interacting transcriptional regulator [Mucilaginibacter sp.]
MEKYLEDVDKSLDNEPLALVTENSQASHLLKLWIAAFAVQEVKELFETVVRHLKEIIDFNAADLLLFENEASTMHTRLSYHGGQFHEFLNVADPLLFSKSGKMALTRHFRPERTRQVSASYWINEIPPGSLFYKKETEFRYTYFIPIFNGADIAGTFQLRTNRENGFTSNENAVFNIVEEILKQVFQHLLKKDHLAPGQEVESLSKTEVSENDQIKLDLFALSGDIAAVRSRDDLNRFVYQKLKHFLPKASILIYRTGNHGESYRPFINYLPSKNAVAMEYQQLKDSELMLDSDWIDQNLLHSQPAIIQLKDVNSQRAPDWLKETYKNGGRNAIISMLESQNVHTGLLIVLFNEEINLPALYLNRIKEVSAQLAIALNNIITNEKIENQLNEIKGFKQQLEIENHYLQEEIETTYNYSDIVGTSEIMKKVFFLVSQVADTPSSVLILGETGTGKELIARALHNASSRRKKLMVKVNCASLPPSLIESELFGHEKGSFTDATERRIGKFELAHNSTLFLDEVGELPPDLQVKLLRALQEKEIERIGGTSVIKINVRIIAATNRNLLHEVQKGNFRSDLYFRLNVFPITLPPLRDRKDDIPILATHFLEKYLKKGTKRITGFSSKVIKQLSAYNWPGNVRELEHLIERCVLLTNGTLINQVPLSFTEVEENAVTIPDIRIKTIDEVEREHILFVLKKCNNKVAGIGGAADVLKVPASTLNSKMRRLKIRRAFPGKN